MIQMFFQWLLAKSSSSTSQANLPGQQTSIAKKKITSRPPAQVPKQEDSQVDGDLDWPEPTPLPGDLPPVLPFDIELLPAKLQGWVADVSDRMQCPPEFPAVAILVAISSLIGSRTVVAPKAKDNWTVSANLWALVVGRPGVMKSPAMAAAMKPIFDLEEVAQREWRRNQSKWTRGGKSHDVESAAGAIATGNKPARETESQQRREQWPDAGAERTWRRYIVNDTSAEKLAELLAQQPWGLLAFRDEIEGLLRGMERSGQEGARAFYLQAYDGNQSFTVDRIGRGTHFIERLCISMLGGIQPGKLQAYVRDAVSGGAGDDGLLQRFGLFVWPDIDPEFHYVDRLPDTDAMEAVRETVERLNQIDLKSETEPTIWRFDSSAQKLFEQWMTKSEIEIRGEYIPPALASHLSKFRKVVPALALIFALIDSPNDSFRINEKSLRRALQWSKFLRSHAERLYGSAGRLDNKGAKILLTNIQSGLLCDRDRVPLYVFTPRQVAVKNWANLKTPAEVRTAADALVEYGWLRHRVKKSGSGGGRPSDQYSLHPMLREDLA